MSVNLDRRSFMAGASASTVAVAAPVFAITASHERTAWNAGMAAHLRAKAEDAAFNPEYEAIRDAWEAGRPSIDTIHWAEFHVADRNVVARTLYLEKTWTDFLAGEGKWWSGGNPAATQRMKDRQRAALDSVQAFRDAEARHGRESGMDEADDRWNALGETVCDTQRALMDLPAPDLAALRWKLDNLREDDGGLVPWEPHYVRQTFADIDRLMPVGA